jgi:hypothetical protein
MLGGAEAVKDGICSPAACAARDLLCQYWRISGLTVVSKDCHVNVMTIGTVENRSAVWQGMRLERPSLQWPSRHLGTSPADLADYRHDKSLALRREFLSATGVKVMYLGGMSCFE